MLNEIIDSCKYVTKMSEHVKINYNILDKFIDSINYTEIGHWLNNNPYNLFELGCEKVINFLLLFDAIDYSFWGNPKWSIKVGNELKDGSNALLYALLNYVKETNNFDFTKVSYSEFKNILKGNVDIPLIRERYDTLVDISSIVNTKMNGNFYKYIYDIRDDISLFEIIVSNFNSFKDERIYKDKNIYFYKLAQLLVSDILHVRNKLENISVNYDNLVGCADYKIPQTMRELNLIEYDLELSEIIDNKKEIDVNSLYECEIRASMIVVIDYISKRINSCRSDINDYFFLLSRSIKNARPYHLCRCINY